MNDVAGLQVVARAEPTWSRAASTAPTANNATGSDGLQVRSIGEPEGGKSSSGCRIVLFVIVTTPGVLVRMFSQPSF